MAGTVSAQAQLASDNFTRANGSPGSNWTILQGTWTISSDTLINSSAPGNSNPIYWNANTPNANQYAGYKVAAFYISGNVRMGVGVRLQSGSDSGYYVYCNAISGSSCTSFILARSVSNTITTLQTITATVAAGTEVLLEASGTTLSVWTGAIGTGTQIGTNTTDSTYSSGYGGFMCYSTFPAADGITYFEVGNVGTPASTPTFSPVAGAYASTQSVTGSTATSPAELCYTVNGDTPAATTAGTCNTNDASSVPQYCSPGNLVSAGCSTGNATISVSASETINAIATASGYMNSSVATAAYNIGPLPSPTFSPNGAVQYGGTISGITLSAAYGTICYTTDGTTPTAPTAGTCSGGTTQTYSTALSMSSTTTITAIATQTGLVNSAPASALFGVYGLTQIATDSFQRAACSSSCGSGGQLGSNWENADANIGGSYYAYLEYDYIANYWSANTFTATQYSGVKFNSLSVAPFMGPGVNIGVGGSPFYSVVCTAVSGGNCTQVVLGAYYTNTWHTLQTITVSISTSQELMLIINGTVLSVYVAGVQVGTNTTDTNITGGSPGISGGTTTSPISTAGFNYWEGGTPNIPPSPPTLLPAAGIVLSGQAVSFTGCTGTTYYTIDGTTPTTSSTAYSAPFALQTTSGSETVKGVCYASSTYSSIVSAAYTTVVDQTGSYAFSDNFANYYNPIASPCGTTIAATYYCDSTSSLYQLPLDAWNTKGLWTANGTIVPSAVQIVLDPVLGGTNYMLSGGSSAGGSQDQWATYTGATGWNGTNVGQWSKAYFHTGSYNPCVLTFSSVSAGLTGYAMCWVGGGTGVVYLYRISSGTVTTIVSQSSIYPASGSTMELRTLNGVLEPLINGATPSGMLPSYTDATPLTTGNPGVSGNYLYNWTGGTINASSAPSPITWGGNTYSSYGTFAWSTAGDSTWSVYPWLTNSITFSEEPVLTNTVTNTGISSTGTVVTVNSTLNPGTGVSIVMAGVFPTNMGGIVTTTASSSSSFSYSGGQGTANSAISETGTTVTITSTQSQFYGIGQIVSVWGVSPSGYNGNWTITAANTNNFSYTAPSGLGTVTTLGYSASPGQASTYSSSVYALGAVNSNGIAQNMYEKPFLPAQWIQGTVNVDTVNSTVRNWFFKLEGNSAILGGNGCYDLTAYYIGVEPMYQTTGIPPNPVSCSGTAEYCGTNWLHITKATPVTSNNAGGCTLSPNYNVITVSGSNYVPMQNDQILSIYRSTGYLDIYCKGTSRSLLAPAGTGCPSTTLFYRVIHVYDSDLLAPMWSGIGQGYPGVWAATDQFIDVPMSVFSNITMGSVGSDICSTSPSSCYAPSSFVMNSLIP